MGHCEYSRLRDLDGELETIRSWEGIRENSPGVFYWKRIPFLHFHAKDDERWADVKKATGGWVRTAIPFQASALQKASFLREAKNRFAEISAKKTGKKK